MFTDSSDFGYGAHLGQIHRDTVLSGLWPLEQAQKHITFKELKVVQIALEALGPTLKERSVALFSDSSTTVSILQKLYTKSVSLRNILGRIIVLLQKYHVKLNVHHIIGELNTLADLLSRTVERNRYTFDPVALY